MKRVITAKMPDVESLEKDIEPPFKIELLQAHTKGQLTHEYYSKETWARLDREQADKTELLLFPMNSFQRWFWSHAFKAVVIGAGYYLQRKHARYSKTMFGTLPHDLEQDKVVIENAIKKVMPRYPMFMQGYVNAFFDFLSMDNAYEFVYYDIRSTLKPMKKRRKQKA